ncbi:hypothetical protein PFISCL1PPCAC_4024, partial [Pristionchus fissidentatus]
DETKAAAYERTSAISDYLSAAPNEPRLVHIDSIDYHPNARLPIPAAIRSIKKDILTRAQHPCSFILQGFTTTCASDSTERVTLIDGVQRLEAFKQLRALVNKDHPGVYDDQPPVVASQPLSQLTTQPDKEQEKMINPFAYVIVSIVDVKECLYAKEDIAIFKSMKKDKQTSLGKMEKNDRVRHLMKILMIDEGMSMKDQRNAMNAAGMDVSRDDILLASYSLHEVVNLKELAKIPTLDEKSRKRIAASYKRARKVSDASAQLTLLMLIKGVWKQEKVEKVLGEHLSRVSYILMGRKIKYEIARAVDKAVQRSKSAISEIKKVTQERRRLSKATIDDKG